MTISVNTIGSQVSGVPFTVSGSISFTPSIQYLDDAGSYATAPSGHAAAVSGTWNFTNPGLPPGSHTVSVKEVTTGQVGTSNAFLIPTLHTITPTAPSGSIFGQPVAFKGALSGYTSAPALTYKIDSGTAHSLGGVTVSGWATTITVPTSGSHSISVSDGTVSGSASFTTGVASGSGGGASGTIVTWNSATKTSTITLSNGNKTATAGGSTTAYGQVQGVLANVAVPAASGLVAFEVTMGALTQNCTVGVADTTFSLGGNQLGGDTDAIGFYPDTGTGSQQPQSAWYNSAELISGSSASVAGEAISFVVSGSQMWASTPTMRATTGVTWNDSTTADPATGAGGMSFSGIGSPYYPAFNTAEGGAIATINGGDTAFSSFLAGYISAHPSVKKLSGGGGGTAPSGRFSISGGKIYDPNGNLYVAKGINGAGDAPTGDLVAIAGNVMNLFPGINHIRIPVYPTAPGTSGSVYPAPSGFASFVETLTGYTVSGSTWTATNPTGIVIEFEDHNVDLVNFAALPPYTGAALTVQTNWYTAMASYFDGNPYVWLGGPNEMATPDGTYNTVSGCSTWEGQIYNAIRAGSATKMIQLMAGVGGSNVSTVGVGGGFVPAVYSGMTNIVWEIHCYYTNGDSDSTLYTTAAGYVSGGASASGIGGDGGGWGIVGAQTIQSADGLVPVIIGEWGAANNDNTGVSSTQLAAEIQAVQAQGVGATAWWWSTGDTGTGTGLELVVENGGVLSLTGYGVQVSGTI